MERPGPSARPWTSAALAQILDYAARDACPSRPFARLCAFHRARAGARGPQGERFWLIEGGGPRMWPLDRARAGANGEDEAAGKDRGRPLRHPDARDARKRF